MTKILHITTIKHGIGAYSERIEAIYRQIGYEVVPITAERRRLNELRALLTQDPTLICHFEIGAGDHDSLWLSRRLLRQTAQPQFITIHDPGVVVRQPIAVRGATSTVAPLRFAARALRKVLNHLFGRAIVQRHLNSRGIERLYLRPDLADGAHAHYLPQPTYHADVPEPPAQPTLPLRVGIGGYWGRGKGVETLLEAVQLLRGAQQLKFNLVLGGGTAEKEDPYARGLRRSAQAVDPAVELPGFVPDDKIDDFLQSLAVLVLPYWPELPNGTSAMAMRAAELAVPIIASNTPALCGQLGADGASYVTPKDAAELSQAIDHLLTVPDHEQTRARRTQTMIFAEHNWAVVGKALETIISAMAVRS